MNPTAARRLTRLYPRHWRDRYGAEFAALLESEPGGWRTAANVIWSAIREHIRSMRQRESLGLRAPWAMFGIAPLLLLAAAYCAACFILWSGWEMFLPGTRTPFVHIHGFAIFYFGVGRLLYYSAPVLTGWAVALFAIRRQPNAVWPMASLSVLSLLGATAQVNASRVAQSATGYVTLGFGFGQSIAAALLHALLILVLTALPYLWWRVQAARSLLA